MHSLFLFLFPGKRLLVHILIGNPKSAHSLAHPGAVRAKGQPFHRLPDLPQAVSFNVLELLQLVHEGLDNFLAIQVVFRLPRVVGCRVVLPADQEVPASVLMLMRKKPANYSEFYFTTEKCSGVSHDY